MKLKENLKLRRVGARYMLVDVSDSDANVTNVHTLNGTAAFVWDALAQGVTDPEELAARLCGEYEDVDADTARRDVRALLDTWQASGLLTL